jgi:hypothetical protein
VKSLGGEGAENEAGDFTYIKPGVPSPNSTLGVERLPRRSRAEAGWTFASIRVTAFVARGPRPLWWQPCRLQFSFNGVTL